MTQLSYFWDGSTIGDAALAPYNIEDIHALLDILFMSDNTREGVIGGYLNMLAVTNTGGLNMQVDTGAALIKGYFYTNDAAKASAVVMPGAGYNYYTYVLRLDVAAQTIRAVALGPSASGYPTVTQTAATWEIELARVRVDNIGTVSVTDRRILQRCNGYQTIKLRARQGGSSETAYLGGSNNYEPSKGWLLMGLSYFYFGGPGAQSGGTPLSQYYTGELPSGSLITIIGQARTTDDNICTYIEPFWQWLIWVDATGALHNGFYMHWICVGISWGY